MSGARSPYERERTALALAPIDQAFRASEAKWGVARLERLVSSKTLASYQRGWTAYREAVEAGNATAIESIAPKMIAALGYMDREAVAAGHQPLSVDAWEAPLSDGTVLAVVRTMPEAHAMSADAVGRQRVVYSLEEIARIVDHYQITNAAKLAFPGAKVMGAKVRSGVQMSEGELADQVRGEELSPYLHGEVA